MDKNDEIFEEYLKSLISNEKIYKARTDTIELREKLMTVINPEYWYLFNEFENAYDKFIKEKYFGLIEFIENYLAKEKH